MGKTSIKSVLGIMIIKKISMLIILKCIFGKWVQQSIEWGWK
jgi:hypothetical protein